MRILATAALAAAAMLAPATASADDARFLSIGSCMAYLAVASGMDGQSEVPPSVATRMALLGGEFMFEASALGYDDDAAHTYVVMQLAEQNGTVREQGIETLHAAYRESCADLSRSLAG